MKHFTIYHNPRCSKSRQTLDLLKQEGINPKIVLYLEEPPSESDLTRILDFYGIEPRELLRTGEVEYKELNLKDETLDDSKLIKLMSENPKLIERPIVVSSNQAIIGRPPENVLNLITKKKPQNLKKIHSIKMARELTKIKENNILYDEDSDGSFFQIYTTLINNSFFLEFVQRNKSYDGYGANNAIFRISAQKKLIYGCHT